MSFYIDKKYHLLNFIYYAISKEFNLREDGDVKKTLHFLVLSVWTRKP
jgi:hypothetical protein